MAHHEYSVNGYCFSFLQQNICSLSYVVSLHFLHNGLAFSVSKGQITLNKLCYIHTMEYYATIKRMRWICI